MDRSILNNSLIGSKDKFLKKKSKGGKKSSKEFKDYILRFFDLEGKF